MDARPDACSRTAGAVHEQVVGNGCGPPGGPQHSALCGVLGGVVTGEQPYFPFDPVWRVRIGLGRQHQLVLPAPGAGSSTTRGAGWASHGSTASPTEATTSRRDPIPPRFAHYGVEGSSVKNHRAVDQYVAWRQAQGARFQTQAYVFAPLLP